MNDRNRLNLEGKEGREYFQTACTKGYIHKLSDHRKTIYPDTFLQLCLNHINIHPRINSLCSSYFYFARKSKAM
jgi:hypothetical protein